MRLCSYILLGRSYRSYRIAKRVYWGLFRRGIPHRLPSYHKISIIVEGFAHSGNSFVRTNILPGYQTKTSSFHRSWAVKRALDNGIPTVVLVRHPLEAAHSWYYRSRARPQGPMAISLILGCWIFYHASIWSLRRQILLIPFSEIANDYEGTKKKIQTFAAPVRMNEIPDYSGMNRFHGERPPLTLNLLERWILLHAERIYRKYLDFVAENPR